MKVCSNCTRGNQIPESQMWCSECENDWNNRVDTGFIIPFGPEKALVLYRDFSKGEALVKIFPTLDAALTYSHDASLAQLPEWHKEHCPRCLGLV